MNGVYFYFVNKLFLVVAIGTLMNTKLLLEQSKSYTDDIMKNIYRKRKFF